MKKYFFIFIFLVSNIYAFEHLTVENFEEKLRGKNVIVDFYAPWCPPCKVVATTLEEFNKVKPSNVVIYKVNIDEQRDLIKKFDVSSIPTLVFLKNGEKKHLTVGIQSKEQLVKYSKEYLLN